MRWSSYRPVPDDLRAAVELFLAALDRLWIDRTSKKLSNREFARIAKITPAKVQQIRAIQVGLPPTNLRLLLADDPKHESASVCKAYLAAYGSLYIDDPGLKWIKDLAEHTDVYERPGAIQSLERTTSAAMREANRLIDTRSAELLLEDLYVPRRFTGCRKIRTEAELVARCGTGSMTVIVGEPGTGKTSVLWRLAETRRQAGRTTWFVAAGMIETAVSIADIAWALRIAPSEAGPPVLLVDTLDLLLRSDELPLAVDDLIRTCTAAGAALVMTCRPREYEVLRRHAGAYEIEKVGLGPYSDVELPVAVEKHARHFICGPFDPATVAVAIMTAVARGLPITQICQVPLTLRMLFELHQLDRTGDEPLETEIDVTDLFDRYWQLRVRTDARTNRAGAGQDADLSAAAEWLAVVMLAAGTPRIDSASATRVLERVAGLLDDLATLVRRSVVHEVGDGLREFFHQTFFEYAVARAIVALGSCALDALVDRTVARPDDAFLGAVTHQALVYACRTVHDAAAADRAFAAILGFADNGVQQVAIAAYAQARYRGPQTTSAGRRLLAEGGEGLARRYLVFASRVRHDDLGSVLDDLVLVWRYDSDDVRAEMFGALRSLAVVRRDPILDLMSAEDSQYLAWYLGLNPQAAQRRRRAVIELLGELAPADPGWCADRLEDVARKAARDDVQDGLAAVLTVAAEARLPAGRLRRLLAVIPAEAKTNPSGANELGLVTASLIRQIWVAECTDPIAIAEDLLAGVSSTVSLGPGAGWSPPSWLAGPARLRALADLACDQEPAVSERLITVLLSSTDPMARTHIGNYFLKHLLDGKHRHRLPGSPEPFETPATKVARKRCAEALRTAEPARSGDRSDKALWRDALYTGRLPAAEVAAIAAEAVRGGVDPGWLDGQKLAAIVVPAAFGGVPGAQNALTKWSRRSATRPGEDEVRKIIMPQLEHLAVEFPAAFDHLISDALVTSDGRFVDGAVTKVLHKRLALPEDFADRVAPIVRLLLSSRIPATRRHGFAIAARVGHGRIVGTDAILEGLKIRDRNALTAVLNVVEASLEHDAERWSGRDEFARLDNALEVLADTAPDPTLGKRAYTYRRMLHCHSGLISTGADRQVTLERIRELVLRPDDPVLLEPLGRLLSRLVKTDADAAAALLVETAAAIERIAVADSTNSWKSRRAFRLRHDIRNVIVALPYGTWKRTIASLARQDTHVFTNAIDISIRERSEEAAAYIRRLVKDLTLQNDRVEAMLRSATTRRQRVTGGISTWPELLDLWRAAELHGGNAADGFTQVPPTRGL